MKKKKGIKESSQLKKGKKNVSRLVFCVRKYFKMNTPTKRFIFRKKYLSFSYAVFQAYAFLEITFNAFSGVVLGVYRSHCFHRVVVSLNFVIDSLGG